MTTLNKTTLMLAGIILCNFSVAMASVSSFRNTTITDEVYEQEADTLSEQDAAAIDVYRSLKKIGAEKVCASSVVNKDQEGRYYNAIEKSFKKYEFPLLLEGTSDLKAACPRYPNLSQKEKEEVWTTILGAVSFYESTCRQLGVSGGGPNGRLGGPFQLHVGKEKNYGKLCRNGDATTKDENRFIPCVLSMLEGYLGKQQRNGQQIKLFPLRKSGATYWEVLQSNAAKRHRVTTTDAKGNKKVLRGNGADFIKLAIKDYKYCN